VRNRISALKRELTQLEKRRALQSKARWGSGVYRVALVGYTNAGKSTLLNALTDSNVYAKDELFATLDPTTRMVALEEGRQITLTDTVGFIQKLPTMLVEAFKSTLAEVLSADLILLVVDVSDKNAKKEIDAVREVLKDIGATNTNTVLVYNKCDLIPDEEQRSLALVEPHAEFISALQESGLQGLCYRIAKEAASGDRTLSVCIPYSEGKAMSMLHEQCQVIREQYAQEGLCATVKANARVASRLAAFEAPEHVATSHE
jgi:GTP-binding protein HflX